MTQAGLKKKPSVYNIPPGYSFADQLARGLWERVKHDPIALSDYTVLLPSRRGCRTLRDAFLRLADGKPVMLPRLRPIGDVDEDELILQLAAEESGGEENISDLLSIPPAVSKLRRQLLLARIIMKMDDERSFDQAASLALPLGRLLDQVQTERISFDRLGDIVPESYAGHWQETLEFLKILTEHWPAILQEEGGIDFAQRRNILLESLVRSWSQNPPQNPVIAAGSTGTVPAAADVLSLVAHLPQGELVLPGLDQMLDDDSWNKIGEEHPQYNMKKLLGRIGIDRTSVQDWPLDSQTPVNIPRVRLLSEAMRPAETSDAWRALGEKDIPAQALSGLTYLACETPQEEAETIALVLRRVLETPAKTAALITPDRRLARRVSMAMQRWGIDIDDSGGQPLAEMPVGVFLQMTAQMAEENLAPVSLQACLKHPLMAAGDAPGQARLMADVLEQACLRGPRPAEGFDGLQQAIDDCGDAAVTEKLTGWMGAWRQQAGDFIDVMASGKYQSFLSLVKAHIAFAEQLASTDIKTGAERLWRDDDGESAADFLNLLLQAARDVPDILPAQYTVILRTLLKTVTVRPPAGRHPRLYILGQIEARLYNADLVVLGGLNEGTWPDLPDHDPWMSRPMREAFGLPSPERSIGLAAHDFVQAASAGEVYLTRAKRVEGAPTVPARWLLRIETVLEKLGMMDLWKTPSEPWQDWARRLDAPAEIIPLTQPMPKPPVTARPRKLSVTRVEAWMRDPYQIYARYVLGLQSLDPLDADAGAAERGQFIHKAFDSFVTKYPKDLPDNAYEEVLACGQEALSDMRIREEEYAFWWPRFEKAAQDFVQVERDWRQQAQVMASETWGLYTFETENGAFTLTAKADRIDRLPDGSLALIDYKTGGQITKKDVAAGLSPQMPLEGVIAKYGGFDRVGTGDVSVMEYWYLSGGNDKKVRDAVQAKDVSAQIDEALEGVKGLVAVFDNPDTPYLSRPDPDKASRYSDYDHLARVKEWAISGNDDDGGDAT